MQVAHKLKKIKKLLAKVAAWGVSAFGALPGPIFESEAPPIGLIWPLQSASESNPCIKHIMLAAYAADTVFWPILQFQVFCFWNKNITFYFLQELDQLSCTWPIRLGQNDRMDREIISLFLQKCPTACILQSKISCFEKTHFFMFTTY